ncbi:MAG: hypothetical protein ACJAYU_002044 [Bradymonadia bacterium]|jgi:hypothetical protein
MSVQCVLPRERISISPPRTLDVSLVRVVRVDEDPQDRVIGHFSALYFNVELYAGGASREWGAKFSGSPDSVIVRKPENQAVGILSDRCFACPPVVSPSPARARAFSNLPLLPCKLDHAI